MVALLLLGDFELDTARSAADILQVEGKMAEATDLQQRVCLADEMIQRGGSLQPSCQSADWPPSSECSPST